MNKTNVTIQPGREFKKYLDNGNYFIIYNKSDDVYRYDVELYEYVLEEPISLTREKFNQAIVVDKLP